MVEEIICKDVYKGSPKGVFTPTNFKGLMKKLGAVEFPPIVTRNKGYVQTFHVNRTPV